MLRVLIAFFTIIICLSFVRPVLADSPNETNLRGKVVGEGMIYLYANDEAKNSQLNNVLKAIDQLEGKPILPGEIFSFNEKAHLLDLQIPYDLGPDVSNHLVRAGGVCMISTMVATAAHDAGLPFIDDNGRAIRAPRPHSRYYRYYHQVNIVDGRVIPVVEATVAIQRQTIDEPWHTVQDMEFINTSGRILYLHFEPSWTVKDLDLSKPLDHTTQDFTLKVELRALSLGLDSWFGKRGSFLAD